MYLTYDYELTRTWFVSRGVRGKQKSSELTERVVENETIRKDERKKEIPSNREIELNFVPVQRGWGGCFSLSLSLSLTLGAKEAFKREYINNIHIRLFDTIFTY